MTTPTPPNRIEALRNASGLSRAAVADRLGVRERTVDRWEKGEVQISLATASALCRLFGGVSIEHLMGLDRFDGGNGGGQRVAA